ncbi:MAG: dihydropteroate synthase [Clostridiales bacterium]|nr:dihydropteroate synthase [Clostridiales bacterium]
MQIGNREFDLQNRAYIMGILNVTPDSFSDGGKWSNIDVALNHVEDMIENGASIIDIGGESTKPGYIPISEDEEIERVTAYIKKIKENFDIPISIDTYKAEVARAAIETGANLINDIWGFKADKKMAQVAAKEKIPCCIMHNRTNNQLPYTSLMQNILDDLQGSIDIGLKAGLGLEMMITDPGIGFAKTLEENLCVMNEIELLHRLGCPILLGTSRKSMIGLSLELPVEERLEGTLATTTIGVMKGCSIIRVHDVKENYRVLRMTEKILGRG